ncbi:hypothetical protein [Paraburkholderia sediminicola]|uniref:hypothetical protein n=1 Tax=Paraburkholderia sediminicola TaxID=458836 RepID=UPI0038B94A16
MMTAMSETKREAIERCKQGAPDVNAMAARCLLRYEARAFEQQERHDHEQVNAANKHWMVFLA